MVQIINALAEYKKEAAKTRAKDEKRQALYGQYKKELQNPMKESLNGFCDWLIERLNQCEATDAAKVPYGK